MSRKIELLQKALRALALEETYATSAFDPSTISLMEEIEAELAKPEAEPVKLCFPTMLRKMWSGGEVQKWLDEQPPLYTSPRPMQRLTDEEIINLGPGQEDAVWNYDAQVYFANAIMDAMIEKNQ